MEEGTDLDGIGDVGHHLDRLAEVFTCESSNHESSHTSPKYVCATGDSPLLSFSMTDWYTLPVVRLESLLSLTFMNLS